MFTDPPDGAAHSRSSPLRVFYRALFVAARIWWFVRRPHTTGAMVALWNDGRLLLVRSSYRRPCTLPGGFLKRGETARAAAARELFEEVKVMLAPAALNFAWQGRLDFEYRKDAVTIWEADVEVRPPIEVDGVELLWAGWKTPEEARALLLLPHIEPYLDAKRARPRENRSQARLCRDDKAASASSAENGAAGPDAARNV